MLHLKYSIASDGSTTGVSGFVVITTQKVSLFYVKLILTLERKFQAKSFSIELE